MSQPSRARQALRPAPGPAITTTINGLRAELPELTAELPDGRKGYYQRSRTDCLAAALATATQTPYEDCERVVTYGDLISWAEARGLAVRWHLDLPPDSPQWIGFSPEYTEPDGLRGRHTVIGRYGEPYFDPASGWVFDHGRHPPSADAIEFAVTIEGVG